MPMLFSATADIFTGPQAFFAFQQLALSAGCTVTASGDGVSLFSTSGNVITSGNTGAGGLGNSRAYYVLDVGGEQWCFQRGTSNPTWAISVSRTATMTGGAPSATVRPTAADEIFVAGGGTAATPTYTTILASTDYYTILGCDDTAPRRFYVGGYQVNGLALRNLIFRDVVVLAESTDADRYVRGQTSDTNLSASSWAATTGTPTSGPYFQTYVPSTTPSVSVCVPMGVEAYIGSGTVAFPGNVPAGKIDRPDILLGPLWFRASSTGTPLIKGYSTLFAVQGPTRSNTVTYSVTTPRDRIALAGITLPYGGMIPPA